MDDSSVWNVALPHSMERASTPQGRDVSSFTPETTFLQRGGRFRVSSHRIRSERTPAARAAKARSLLRDAEPGVFSMRIAFVFAFAAAGVIGCASAPEPTEEIARARLAVEQAERGDGSALEVSKAREKLAAAQRFAAEREHDAARRSAEQAEVDARLALATAQRAKTEESVHELERTIQAMQEEMSHDVP
jgi:hypothetical protein